MVKFVTYYFVSNEDDEQMSMPTKSYYEAKEDLKFYQSYGSGRHKYKIESFIDEEEE